MKRTKRLIAWLLTFAILLTGCGATAVAETPQPEPQALLEEAIAQTFLEQTAPADWVIFDLAAYGAEISEETKAAYLQSALNSVSSEFAAPTDLAKAAIILSSLGIDIAEADIPEKIHSLSSFATYSDAIWILISDSLDTISLSDEQKISAVAKISESISDKGLLFGTYGDYTYDDPDSTGAAIGAMAYLIDDEDTFGANALYEKMLVALSESQGENGSYGSACTDAFVIIGLCAAGIDADEDERFVKGENSLLDGLMSFAIEGGFAGYDGSLDLDWSTEQGFRALIAYRNFAENGTSFNLYYTSVSADDDENKDDENEPEDGEGENSSSTTRPGGQNAVITPSETPDAPSDDEAEQEQGEEAEQEDNLIRVTFEMKTHKKIWISAHTVKTQKNISVKNLIAQVFEEYGVESSGLSTGYLRSVTYNGETWGEFDAGGGSGWQYYVNGDLPRVGIGSYKLKDGDFVSLSYTADYTAEEKPEKTEEAEKNKEETKEDDETEDAPKANPYDDVSESDWFFDSVCKISESGLMNGLSEKTFAPKLTLSRAMFVTVLYRLEGSPEASASVFKDIPSGAWYASSVAWASEKGIVSGLKADIFAPDSPVTREQMATLAYRYAAYKGKAEASAQKLSFEDSESISAFAKDAVCWANESGIMNGTGNAFNPKNGSTRAEAAAVFCRLYDYMK